MRAVWVGHSATLESPNGSTDAGKKVDSVTFAGVILTIVEYVIPARLPRTSPSGLVYAFRYGTNAFGRAGYENFAVYP